MGRFLGFEWFELYSINLYLFTESKVGQFEVSVSVDENVVRFDISMDVVHFMHLFDGYY